MIDPIKRVHYFDRQFLRAGDFAAEQAYHLEMRRRHNRLLHTWGVATGLDVTRSVEKPAQITITAGAAYDSEGREIVLTSDQMLDLSRFPPDTTVFVTITYREYAADPSDETGTVGDTRIVEEPLIDASTVAPPAEEAGRMLVLARVDRARGAVVAVDKSLRRAAGAVVRQSDVGVLGVPRGAVIWFAEGQQPPGVVRLEGMLGRDIGAWELLPPLPDHGMTIDHRGSGHIADTGKDRAGGRASHSDRHGNAPGGGASDA